MVLGRLATLALLLLVQPAVQGFYDDGSDGVVSLTPSNLKQHIKPNTIWLSEFYAPWCGHCQALTPEWKKTAKALKGILGVAAIDADAHKELGGQFSIQGFPTIKILGADAKGKVSSLAEYKGERTAAAMVEWALTTAKKLALKRIGAKSSSSSGGSSGGGGGAGPSGGGDSDSFYRKTDVVTLNGRNFESEVIDGDDLWFVEFYAPWCGHCKALKPAWIEAAMQLKGKVKVGAIDCTVDQGTCQEYGVQGYPTIKWFGTNKRRPEAYNGARDSEGIVAYALERWSKNAPPPEVKELVDAEVWTTQCVGSEGDEDLGLAAVQPKKLCLIAFLPHILDSKADGREGYLSVLKATAETFKDRPFSYLWAEGGGQSSLEANFDVGGYGYPALVAFSPVHNKYAPLKLTFDKKHIKDFIVGVQKGFERVTPVKGALAAVETITPWDGQDGHEPVEEEFDLAELMGDDTKEEL